MPSFLSLLVLVLVPTCTTGFINVKNVTQSLLDEGLPLYYNWCDNSTVNGCSPHKVQAYGWCVAYAWTETFETQLFRAGGGSCKPPVWVRHKGYECPDAPRCKVVGKTCVPASGSVGGGASPRMSMTPYFACKQQLMNSTNAEVGSISDFTVEFGSWDESAWPSDGLLDMCLNPGQHATTQLNQTEAWAKAQKLKKWYTVEEGWDFDNDVCLVKKFSIPYKTYSNNLNKKPALLQPGEVGYWGSYEDCRENYYGTKPVGKWCDCSYGVKNAAQMTKGNIVTAVNLVPQNVSDIAKMMHEWGPWWNHVPAPFAVLKTDRTSPYKKCSTAAANHMVSVVGWDARPGGLPSWIVRDSLLPYPAFAYIEMNGNCHGGQGFGHLNRGGFLGMRFEGMHNPTSTSVTLEVPGDSESSPFYSTLVSELVDIY